VNVGEKTGYIIIISKKINYFKKSFLLNPSVFEEKTTELFHIPKVIKIQN
jgi:hypothetical protein